MRPLSKATLPLEHRAGDKEYNSDTHVPPAADEYYYSSSSGDDDDDGNTGVGPENVVGAEKKKNAKGTKKAKRLLNKKLGRAPTEAEVAKKVRALQKKAAAKQQAAAKNSCTGARLTLTNEHTRVHGWKVLVVV